jgi:hypothetical protein
MWAELLSNELSAYILTNTSTEATIKQLLNVVLKVVVAKELPDIIEAVENNDGTTFFYFLGTILSVCEILTL